MLTISDARTKLKRSSDWFFYSCLIESFCWGHILQVTPFATGTLSARIRDLLILVWISLSLLTKYVYYQFASGTSTLQKVIINHFGGKCRWWASGAIDPSMLPIIIRSWDMKIREVVSKRWIIVSQECLLLSTTIQSFPSSHTTLHLCSAIFCSFHFGYGLLRLQNVNNNLNVPHDDSRSGFEIALWRSMFLACS